MKWKDKRKVFAVIGGIGLSLVVLAAFIVSLNHRSIDFKDEEDRLHVTEAELETIEEKTLGMKGVKSFTIHHLPDGLYGELIVESKEDAKAIAEEVFALMVRETVKSVDLFVKLDDKDQTLLIQAFKAEGEDEFRWHILY